MINKKNILFIVNVIDSKIVSDKIIISKNKRDINRWWRCIITIVRENKTININTGWMFIGIA